MTAPGPVVSEAATITIERAPDLVWAAIADITRTGEWSPECTGGRWVGGATGPAVGARFEGDNAMVVGGITLKRWTTTSEVTACEPGRVFEFVAEGYTTWRYELQPAGTGTLVTESYAHAPHAGWQKFLYDTVARRDRTMRRGMERTLERLRSVLEAN